MRVYSLLNTLRGPHFNSTGFVTLQILTDHIHNEVDFISLRCLALEDLVFFGCCPNDHHCGQESSAVARWWPSGFSIRSHNAAAVTPPPLLRAASKGWSSSDSWTPPLGDIFIISSRFTRPSLVITSIKSRAKIPHNALVSGYSTPILTPYNSVHQVVQVAD